MMKLSNKLLVPLVIFFALMSTLGIFFLSANKTNENTAYIYKDGELVEEVDLSKVDKTYTIKVGGNVVLVEKNCISMKEASCPDKLCIKQGRITNGSHPVVCLPNRVVIKVGKEDGGADAVSGK